MADFQFFLNRQGPRGPQGLKGDKGDDGKTPVPRTGTNTPIETTVIFDTGDGNPYETPNLKYPIEDRGGNMVMLDRTDSTQYYGTPDQATDNSYGVVKLATPESVLDDPLDDDVVTYELFDDNNQAIKTVTDGLVGDITQLNTNLGNEVTNRTNADNQLTNKINTDVGNEATARTNADNALSGRIDNLTTSKADKSDVYTKTQTDSLLGNKSNVGHTHNYNEITDKPTIGNGTITFTQGGVTKGSFTTNQSGNSTIALDAGGGGGTSFTTGTGLELTDQNILNVKIDGSTITTNASGELVASGSAPSNMVTTNTAQTITSRKAFTGGISFSDASNTYYLTQYGSGYPIVINGGGNTGRVQLTSKTISLTTGQNNRLVIGDYYGFASFEGTEGLLIKTRELNGVAKNYLQSYGDYVDQKIYRYASSDPSTPSTLTNFLLESDMLDGTTIQYNSTSGKVEVVGGGGSGGITKKTITQASANVSISNNVVTVTDNDVTTNTLVTLYPSDTTTETFLTEHLASNIITEGSGSFTFTLDTALPATFSMYYTIQGVS